MNPSPQSETEALAGRAALVLLVCKDELTKEACDSCEDCHGMVMCRFHSILSLLNGDTTLSPK